MPKPSAPNFIRSLRALSLSETRKADLRAELAAYADLHAVAAQAPRRAVRSPFYTMRLWYGVAAFVLIILVGGSSAAYASTDSLPGDTLYPVKVAVAEPIQSALTTQPAAKAQLHVAFAERRLEEATQLAARGQLDPATQTFLAQQVDAQVRDSAQLADQLAANGQADTSVAVRTDLSARLAAHAELLNLIAAHLAETASTSTQEAASQALALADTARAREASVNPVVALAAPAPAQGDGTNDIGAAPAAAPDVTATTSLEVVAVAAKTTNTAVTALRVAALVAPATTTPPAGIVETQVSKAESHLTDAKEQLASNQPRAAARNATEAAKDSEVAQIIVAHEGLLKSLGITATSSATTTRAAAHARASAHDGRDGANASSTTATTTPASGKRPLWIRLVEPILGS